MRARPPTMGNVPSASNITRVQGPKTAVSNGPPIERAPAIWVALANDEWIQEGKELILKLGRASVPYGVVGTFAGDATSAPP